MRVPLEVSFRGVERTEVLDDQIRAGVEHLERVCDNPISCHLAIEQRHQHQRTGRPYRVRLDARIPPGHEIVVKRDSTRGHMQEDLVMILNDVFDTAERKLRKVLEQQRGRVKTHPEQEVAGFVDKLFPDEGYGFIRCTDGREIYFHRHSVLHNDFERLEIGTGVRFVEEAGCEGPQASTVQIVDKPGSRISESE